MIVSMMSSSKEERRSFVGSGPPLEGDLEEIKRSITRTSGCSLGREGFSSNTKSLTSSRSSSLESILEVSSLLIVGNALLRDSSSGACVCTISIEGFSSNTNVSTSFRSDCFESLFRATALFISATPFLLNSSSRTFFDRGEVSLDINVSTSSRSNSLESLFRALSSVNAAISSVLSKKRRRLRRQSAALSANNNRLFSINRLSSRKSNTFGMCVKQIRAISPDEMTLHITDKAEMMTDSFLSLNSSTTGS
mmetsp:Transcript_13324/g.22917  ORF Transcript_13324/g.22917 Transcript_13324/m.22917 type:complete len:251 (+) Transcript_13324:1181-1933(+)